MVMNSWEDVARRAARHTWETSQVHWHLGFTAFGGPPVHFKIFHDKFVTKLAWVDEQLYQELFSIAQALSGPGSTKMLYCINLIHDGFLGAILAFCIWSLPGALGMIGLSIGVSKIGDTLPAPVYALLSGLNAATVGIIALAAVELSNKAVTDKPTRIVVFLAATGGMLYNALWYFPVLMFAAGCATIIHDYRWIHRPVRAIRHRVWRMRTAQIQDESTAREEIQLETNTSSVGVNQESERESEERVIPQEYRLNFSWKSGTAIIAVFFISFIVIMVLRGVLRGPPLLFRLFANLYLAGTIIFGGGPVVIPLLREYVVAEGWVSPRDFLIGLAIAQSFPGPNFNFAVFLGSLTAINNGYSSVAGAVIAFFAIFTPGIVLVQGTMGIWGVLRGKRWVKSAVRGVNAGAVGLIFTAVYRIWQIGYLDKNVQSGRSLGDDPWWVVVTATAYVGGRYFSVAAPLAILLGAALGLVRYGIIRD
ncbi:putative chromate transport protein [Cladobotryum mycophilum]|uniref:Chromate transport protein n=1 Tax=Cladobotryum mycophilum TaxID=491253 RepID=A0ABR0SH96_9HYPO